MTSTIHGTSHRDLASRTIALLLVTLALSAWANTANAFAIPPYGPNYWNDNSDRKFASNCYNYAANVAVYNYERQAQPGVSFFGADLVEPGTWTCNVAVLYTALDGTVGYSDGFSSLQPISSNGTCDSGFTKIALFTFPFDYHFYRQDSNGRWSHKPGYSHVRDYDFSGNTSRKIYDPRNSNTGEYKNFCSFMCTASVAESVNGEVVSRQNKGIANIKN